MRPAFWAAIALSLAAQQLPPPPAVGAATASLEGSVTDFRGHPIVGRVLTLDSTLGSRTAPTDAQGHYVFDGLPVGTVALGTGTAEGYMPQRKRVSLNLGLPARIDLRLHKAPILAGRVLDSDKNPVAGVLVRARKEGYLFGRPRTLALSGATTNALGEFRMVVAGTGAFTVDVETKQRRFQVLPADLDLSKQQPVVMDTRTYYPGSTLPDGASRVTLRPDDVVEGVEITMLRGPTVCLAAKVVLPGSASSQVSLAIAEAYNDSQSMVASGAVPAGTLVEACGVPEGLYEVTASTMGGARLSVSETVAVSDRSVEAPTLYPQPAMDIGGHIVFRGDDKQKADIQWKTISILASPDVGLVDVTLQASIDNSGAFKIAGLDARTYGLAVRGLPPHVYVEGITQAGRDVYTKPLFPEPGELTLALAGDGPTVSGTVVDDNGLPVPDATVALAAWPLPSSPASNQFLTARVGSGGEFLLSGVPPGQYRLFAFPGVEVLDVDPNFLRGHANDGEDLDLTPGLEASVRPVAAQSSKL